MGNEIFTGMSRQKQSKIAVIGAENAPGVGLLSRLKHREKYDPETYSASLKFVQKINFAGYTAMYIDFLNFCTGRRTERPFYASYIPRALAIVFILQSESNEFFDEALDELVKHVLLDDKTKDKVIMILADNQDEPEAKRPKEIEEALQEKFKFSPACTHTVFVLPCSVKANEGLDDGFRYFAKQIQQKKLGTAPAGLIPYSDKMFADTNPKEKQDVFNFKEGVKHSCISINSFFCRRR